MSNKAITLTPKPYIIESHKNAEHWDWSKALSEFVDNALGEAAGNANTVDIEIHNSKVVIKDNGRGIEKLEQCFTLGDSSSKNSQTDIGRYGVGAKYAAIWMAKVLHIQTVRDGKASAFRINWDAIRQGEDWPEYTPSISNTNSATGTEITCLNFWPGRKRIVTSALVRSLSETFAPALKQGKVIRIHDKRKGHEHTFDLVPWQPRGLSDFQSFAAEIDGREMTCEVGILSDAYSSDSGMRFCYGHRMINHRTKLAGQTLPVRLFGYVFLSHQWKDRLTTNKTNIVDPEDLEEFLINHPAVKRAIQDAEEYHHEMLIENILPKIEAELSASLRKAADGDQLANRKEPKNEGTNTAKHPAAPAEPAHEDGDPAKPDKSTGIKIKYQQLGQNMVGRIEESSEGIAVCLNKDCPIIEDVMNDAVKSKRGHYPGLFAVIASIFCIHIQKEGKEWMYSVFKAKSGSEGRVSAIESFLNYWFFKVSSQQRGDDE